MASLARSRSQVFDSLHNRAFLWLWLGRLAASATFEMGGVAQGWLVYQLSNSALILGLVGVGSSLMMLVLAPYGGVITERLPKRTLLLWTRAGMALNSLVIGLLISLGVIQVWHLAVSSFFTGVLMAFMLPAQTTIISDLVDRRTLMNAFSLDALGMGLMGLVGSSVSGWLIESVGVAGVYYIMLGFFLLSVYSLSRLPETATRDPGTASVWREMWEGMRYLGTNPVMLGLLGVSLCRVLFAMPYRTLMPAFSQENLHFGAAGLGLLMAAPTAGALIISLVLAGMGDFRGKGTLLLASGVFMGVALILFVAVPWLPLTFLFLVAVGIGNNIAMVASNTLVQTHCDPDCRGRVVSVNVMLWGLTPLGTLPAGAIADRVGVPLVVGVQGALVILFFLAIARLFPQIRRLD